MITFETFLFFSALLSLNLWLVQWSRFQINKVAGLTLLLIIMIWLLEPWLLNQSLLQWQQYLLPFHELIALGLCLESWFLWFYHKSSAYIGVSGILAIVYLQLQLYQSGWFELTFSMQTIGFAFTVLLLGFFYLQIHRRWIWSRNLLLLYMLLLWCLSWLSFCQWPKSLPQFYEFHYIKTAWLLLALVLMVIVVRGLELIMNNGFKKSGFDFFKFKKQRGR